MRAAAVLLCLAIVGCPKPKPAWRITGATPAQVRQAQALIDAARRLSLTLPTAGYVAVVLPGKLDGWCGEKGAHITGCNYANGVEITATPDQDLLTTALAHELCHYEIGPHESMADACSTMLVAEAARQLLMNPVQ